MSSPSWRLRAAGARLPACTRKFGAIGGAQTVGGAQTTGCESPAHFLVVGLGLPPGAARDKLRVARALGDLPGTDAAFPKLDASRRL